MRLDAKVAALALLLAACGLSTGPGGGLETPQVVELAVGEEMQIPGTVLRVGFVGVASDSRCPIGVVCVWEGNAAAELGLAAGSGPTTPQVLNTSLDPGSVDFAGVRVTLVDVAPWPVDGQPTDPADYVATLSVEAVEP
jgi:hypothetical protein